MRAVVFFRGEVPPEAYCGVHCWFCGGSGSAWGFDWVPVWVVGCFANSWKAAAHRKTDATVANKAGRERGSIGSALAVIEEAGKPEQGFDLPCMLGMAGQPLRAPVLDFEPAPSRLAVVELSNQPQGRASR